MRENERLALVPEVEVERHQLHRTIARQHHHTSCNGRHCYSLLPINSPIPFVSLILEITPIISVAERGNPRICHLDVEVDWYCADERTCHRGRPLPVVAVQGGPCRQRHIPSQTPNFPSRQKGRRHGAIHVHSGVGLVNENGDPYSAISTKHTHAHTSVNDTTSWFPITTNTSTFTIIFISGILAVNSTKKHCSVERLWRWS